MYSFEYSCGKKAKPLRLVNEGQNKTGQNDTI